MSAIRRVLPAPILTVALLALWLAIAGSASAGQLTLGFIFAVGLPVLTTKLRASGVRIRRPLVIARYTLTIAYDVVHSNLEVARDVIALAVRRPESHFVVIPLDLRDPVGLAVLAMVTTVVPGTVWSELALDGTALMLHVWDVSDEPAFVARYKARYEQPLREIFE
jgi:multicomponent K+:H+ antiporter subunit E